MHRLETMAKREHERLRRWMEQRLVELYRAAHVQVRDGLALPDPSIGEPGDEGDDANRTLAHDARLRVAEADAALAQRLEEALRRMNRGEYGTCVDCGGEIEPRRLESVPWALRCLECQEAIEFDGRDRSPSL